MPDHMLPVVSVEDEYTLKNFAAEDKQLHVAIWL